MVKRQEIPYAAQVAAMSKPKLTAEIGRLVSASIAAGPEPTVGVEPSEYIAERLRICSAEDEKRGGTCYPAAMKKINAAIGWIQTGPREFHVGSIIT